MDYLFTKATAIEVLTTGLMLYYFPKTSIMLVGVVALFKFYKIKTNTTSSKINKLSMRAALYHPQEFIKIDNIKIPTFSKDQVLVEVKASSINPVDYKLRHSNFPFYRWLTDTTVGRDFSGIIMDVGQNVTKFKVGDSVFGNACGGSLQEYTVCNQNEIAHKPSNFSFPEAASIGLAGVTSLQALKYWGDLQDKKVLIIGASGGCGSLGVQIAKYYKSKVFAVCSAKNVEFVTGLGADVVVDYTKNNFLEEIKNENFDLIYDTVTSPEDADQEAVYRPFLKLNGKYVAINGQKLDFFKGILSKFGLNFEKKDYHCVLLNWNTEDLEVLKKMAEENALKTKIQTFAFDKKDIHGAFELLQSRRAVGKIVFELL